MRCGMLLRIGPRRAAETREISRKNRRYQYAIAEGDCQPVFNRSRLGLGPVRWRESKRRPPKPNAVLSVRLASHFLNGGAKHWMGQIRSQFRQRHKRESPLMQPQVGNLKVCLENGLGAVEQYVYVDDSRPESYTPLPAQLPLDSLSVL